MVTGGQGQFRATNGAVLGFEPRKCLLQAISLRHGSIGFPN